MIYSRSQLESSEKKISRFWNRLLDRARISKRCIWSFTTSPISRIQDNSLTILHNKAKRIWVSSWSRSELKIKSNGSTDIWPNSIVKGSTHLSRWVKPSSSCCNKIRTWLKLLFRVLEGLRRRKYLRLCFRWSSCFNTGFIMKTLTWWQNWTTKWTSSCRQKHKKNDASFYHSPKWPKKKATRATFFIRSVNSFSPDTSIQFYPKSSKQPLIKANKKVKKIYKINQTAITLYKITQ